MKRTTYCLLIILCPLLNLFAESLPIPKVAQIGDTLADARLKNVVNYDSGDIMLSDFKGKHILIDFFATTCGSCVLALPRLDSLQQEYGNNIQIIVVASDPKEKIESFLKKYKLKKGIALPFVTNDSTLCNMFPHKLIPHEVWLDGMLRVSSITHGWEITAENIKKMLSDPLFKFPMKQDLMDFDRTLPLLENGNGGNLSNIIHRSTITGFLDGLGSLAGSFNDLKGNSQRIYYVNYTIIEMYMIALGINYPYSRIVLDVKDSSRFKSINSFKTEGTSYCYEQVSPLSESFADCKKGMLQDLDRFFSLAGKIEKRTAKCYVITRKNMVVKLGKTDASTIDSMSLKGVQQTISGLVMRLNQNKMHNNTAPIFLDETDDPKHLAPAFEPSLIGITLLKKQLSGYGLDVLETERPIDMLVISDNR